jgi:hypothetical protein
MHQPTPAGMIRVIGIYSNFVDIELHLLHPLWFFKTQNLLVQFDVPHRLALLSPAVFARILPMEKPECPQI